ncbi:MAG TPA: DUF2726 domain-containing protein [Candidatus Paceibacterota bacterium]|jgi:very-short-patch-repair endonuclease
MNTLIILAAVLVVLFVIGFVFKLLSETEVTGITAKPKYNYTKRRYLMTRAEHDCYKLLARGLGDQYFVFAQVHLPEIVSEKVPGQKWRPARAHIDRKSVDFVICDKEGISPLLAIELDDWSHNREDRQERDREVERILAQAGLPLLRITDMEDLVNRVQAKLGASEHA